MPDVALKKGWTRVGFGDVVKLSGERSRKPEEDGFERFVGLEHIDPGDLKIRRWGDITDGTTFTCVFRPGQVLFGKRRAYQRKVAVADFSGVCSGDIYVFEPNNAHLLPELLPFICQTDGFFEHAIGTSAGSLSPRTNWESLAAYEFALPPLEEQRLLAKALAAHDLNTDALLDARAATIRLRKSVLVQLFSSMKTTQHNVSLRALLAHGSLLFQTGPFGTVLSAAEYRKNGWPIVNPTHINEGDIVHGSGPCVDDGTARRLAKYRMQAGDILITRKGEIDKSCLVTSAQDGWIVGSDCILLRPDATVISGAYFLLFLQCPTTVRMLHSFAHGTVMPGLNEQMLARLIMPKKTLIEQEQEAAVFGELDSALWGFKVRLEEIRELRVAFLSRMLLCQQPEANKHVQ